MNSLVQRLKLEVTAERWPLTSPFSITGHVFTHSDVVVVRLCDGQHSGRGESSGVYYHGDTSERMVTAIESVRNEVEAGVSRDDLQSLLPPGARNAVDCALWDLEAARANRPVWALVGMGSPQQLLSTCTVGAGEPSAMAAKALAFEGARAIKLKLLGDGLDAVRVTAVREACPDVYLAVDANQGFTPKILDELWPTLINSKVALVEQPFPVGSEALLDGLHAPIPIAADESVQSLGDIAELEGRFDVVNIKLDKCGGLTEGLRMAAEAKRLGMKVMVGNMTGTSLAMAPAFILGQLCDVVDLDGPMLLSQDRTPGVVYANGEIGIPQAFWGGVST